ncbi:DUF202 domain-containing protein [Streptomyces catenulae]|uniref:DUF202 domain-containing protein n=1 Tax=Streptomyces catenulae TaxID=66875 RepID=A0ABV2Z094_9ACTN|nr:DUF202 domain-containing protein [Streptomyces catenulae]
MGTAPDGSGARDPGLQPERTRLAWRRTTLSCTVVVALAVRRLTQSVAPGVVTAGAVALTGVAWLVFGLVAHGRMRAMAAGRPPVLGTRGAGLVALCTVVLAVSVAVVLVGGG